jgi:hypothetical protein
MDLSDKKKQRFFTWAFISIYGLYIITFLGVISINSRYIFQLRNILEVISCILLILRFNPYSTHEITKFDKNLIFSVSLFLLLNILISEIYYYYSHIPIINSLKKNSVLINPNSNTVKDNSKNVI